jgi:hypothetical protein
MKLSRNSLIRSSLFQLFKKSLRKFQLKLRKIVQVLSQNTEVREVEIKEKTVVVDKFVEFTPTLSTTLKRSPNR